MVVVTPFPRAVNRPYIERHAARMAGFRADRGEQHLRRLIALHVDTMRRRGIDESAIADEARAVESAIRAALWHRVIRGGGSA